MGCHSPLPMSNDDAFCQWWARFCQCHYLAGMVHDINFGICRHERRCTIWIVHLCPSLCAGPTIAIPCQSAILNAIPCSIAAYGHQSKTVLPSKRPKIGMLLRSASSLTGASAAFVIIAPKPSTTVRRSVRLNWSLFAQEESQAP